MKILYPLEAANRVGELGEQLYYLRNLYFDRQSDLVVIIYTPEKLPRLNQALFSIATRGLTVVTSPNDELVQLGRRIDAGQKLDIELPPGYEFAPFGQTREKIAFSKQFGRSVQKPFHYTLSDEERASGLQLRDRLGIPRDAKIATVHARESGYLPNLSYHSFRDVDIQTYVPAIEHLVDQGFWVVRIGDSSMVPLKTSRREVVDLTTLQPADDFSFPYFVAESSLFLGTASGPSGVARAFHIPCVDVNWPIDSAMWGGSHDLLVPMHHKSLRLNRRLTYEEILMSSLPECWEADEYVAESVELERNSPEEVLAAVDEMIHRLEGRFQTETELIAHERRTRAIEEKAHRLRVHQPELRMPMWRPFVMPCQISKSFTDLNPEFLGHDWREPLPCNVSSPADFSLKLDVNV